MHSPPCSGPIRTGCWSKVREVSTRLNSHEAGRLFGSTRRWELQRASGGPIECLPEPTSRGNHGRPPLTDGFFSPAHIRERARPPPGQPRVATPTQVVPPSRSRTVWPLAAVLCSGLVGTTASCNRALGKEWSFVRFALRHSGKCLRKLQGKALGTRPCQGAAAQWGFGVSNNQLTNPGCPWWGSLTATRRFDFLRLRKGSCS